MINLASEFRLSFGEPMTTSSFKEYPPRKLSYPTLKEKEHLQTAKSIPQKFSWRSLRIPGTKLATMFYNP